MPGHYAADMTGMRFGKLVVIEKAETIHNRAMWLCQCDCGSQPKIIRGQHLRTGATISCGCVRKERSIAALTKHGGTKDRLYSVWYDMRQRCRNQKLRCYKNYGGRGIRVCEEWEKDYGRFRDWALKNGYDPKAKYSDCTIDRIDVDGNYIPENCRFANAKQQASNRRKRVAT